MTLCKAIGCCNTPEPAHDFCFACETKEEIGLSLSEKYPDQFKTVGDITEIDAFGVLQLFQLQDPSGCLHHSVRLMLRSGTPEFKNVREARDTLTRWLQLNQGTNT
jgi:hypothetical protein